MSDSPIDFYYDVGSPYSYLASRRTGELAERTGRPVRWRAFLVGGVFKLSNNTMPAANPAKAAYLLDDLAREAARFGAPFRFHPDFPVNTLHLQRACIAAERRDPALGEAVATELFRAVWVDNVAQMDVAGFGAAVARAGVEPSQLFADAQESSNKEALKAATSQAVALGCFGAPSFLVDGSLFWGHDRIDQLIAHLG